MKNERVKTSVSGIPVKIGDHKHAPYDGIIASLHYHDEIELLSVESGCEYFRIDGQKIDVGPGQVIFVNARVPHETGLSGDPVEGVLLQLRAEDFLSVDSPESAKYIARLRRSADTPYKVVDDPSLVKRMRGLCEEQTGKKQGYRSFILSGIHEIVGGLVREGILTDSGITDPDVLPRLLPALRYIDGHFDEALSLEGVASAVGLNRCYFCRLFKKATGTGFSDYLNFVRVCKAEKLLRETDKTILEISMDTGFSSVSYFTQIFRRYKSCTPSACRRAVHAVQ